MNTAQNLNEQPRDPLGKWKDMPGVNSSPTIGLTQSLPMAVDEQVDFFAAQRAEAPLPDVVTDYENLRLANIREGREIEDGFREAIYRAELREKVFPRTTDKQATNKLRKMNTRQLVEAWDACGSPGTLDGKNPSDGLRDAVSKMVAHDIRHDSAKATDEFLSVSLQLQDEDEELDGATIYDVAPGDRETIDDNCQRFMMESYDILSRNNITPDQWGGELGLAGAGTGFTDRDYAPKENLEKLDELKTEIVGYGDTSPVMCEDGKVHFE